MGAFIVHTVIVHRPVVVGTDPIGVPVRGEPERDVVEGVLVAPAGGTPTAQSAGAGRERRSQAALELHFPSGYDASLLDCTVDLPAPWGEGWRVVGDPMPYDPGLVPGPWNRPVEVVRTNV
jgi:hypothetical protein